MHVINKEGKILEFIYTSHDRFLEDIDHYLNENYIFNASRTDSIGLLDVVCGHLKFWQYEKYNENQQFKLIYDSYFQENDVLHRLMKDGDPIPEMVIYEFKGISVYDELNADNIILKDSFETIEIQLDYTGKLILTSEEFEDLGGEITLPEDEDDELEIELTCSGDVYFFMEESDEKLMGDYMILCIEEINNIYSIFGLPLIELID